jgi:DNA polymerase I
MLSQDLKLEDTASEVEEEEEEKPEEREPEEELSVHLKLDTPSELDESVLLTVVYDGERKRAVCLLYNVKTEKLFAWYDNTGHRPYLLTDIPADKLKQLPDIANNRAVQGLETITKFHALDDKMVRFTKVMADDPLTIGGRKNSLRERLPSSWEARIRYANCFMYDTKIIPGTKYRLSNGNLLQVSPQSQENMSEVAKVFSQGSTDSQTVMSWFRTLSEPAPNFRRLALDIEVETEENRLPNAEEANQRVIAVSFYGSDGVKRALVLIREDRGDSDPGDVKELPPDLQVEFYTDESNLLRDTFALMSAYPIILTFNGDNFDLKYLYHRALKLGFQRNQIPITLGHRDARLTTGVHLDLFQFFKNRAVQIYAFDMKYKEFNLDSITSALIGKNKVDLNGKFIDSLSPYELAHYCFRDAQITYELTSFSDNLVMKLIALMMRTSRTGMDDLVRTGVSTWIKNLMYAIHRERNYLIPNPEDIAKRKHVSSSAPALIKGKKYKGAIVINPKAGVYFDVTVLDFASLYPSILKEYNLSYETVRCPHPECQSNIIPETNHWVCKKRKGVASELVGLFRDFRVLWFKPKSKDNMLSKEYRSWYDVAQRALKVFVNASYGVFGAETFPFYCLPVAESTAAMARYIITSTIKKAEETGMKVLYGDTDSLFVLNPNEKQIHDLVDWAKDKLKVDLDVDKRFRYVAFSERKKNYFGVKEGGAVEIKGLLGKKRNTPPIIQKTFQRTLEELSSVKSPEEFENAKKKVRKILKDEYTVIKARKFDIKDMAISVMLNKNPDRYTKTTPQHIKAARLLEAKMGRKVLAGDLIHYVKTYDGVQPIELAKPEDVDVEKYIELLRSTFDQILDALGVDFDEAMGEKTLESFFVN